MIAPSTFLYIKNQEFVIGKLSLYWTFAKYLAFSPELLNYLYFLDVLQDVMSQICSTLFDYPSIRQCAQLQTFIRKCVHTAWSLVSQVHSPNGQYIITSYTVFTEPGLHHRVRGEGVQGRGACEAPLQ